MEVTRTRRIAICAVFIAALMTVVWSRQVPSLHIDASKRLILTPLTLSVLRSDGNGCAWSRVDPLRGEEALVHRIDASCNGLRISWSNDGTRAVISVPQLNWQPTTFILAGGPSAWFDEPPPARLVEVAFSSGGTRDLPIPGGDTRIVAYSSSGELAAIVRQEPSEPTFRHDVRVLKLGRFGWRGGIEPADRWEGRHAPLSPRTAELLRRWPGSPVGIHTSPAPRVVTAQGAEIPVLAWMEGAIMTGPVLFSSSGRLVAADRSTQGALSGEERGVHLLVSDVVTGTNPRLYDVRSRALVYSSDIDQSVTFWPIPDAPFE